MLKFRSVLATIATGSVLLAGGALATTGAPTQSGMISGPKVFLWTTAGRPAAAPAPVAPRRTETFGANNLIFHGGVVEHHPHVYLTFWGAEWKTGFKIGPGPYTERTAINYETKFFANVGGSKWHGVQSQYCDGILAGSLTCGQIASSFFVQNNKDVLKGVWVDPLPVPASIVATGLAQNLITDPIATEAVRAAKHFGTSDPDATFFVFTPPGHAATAYGSVYCAYHSEVTNPGGHGIRYSFMPFTPEQGAGCGGASVNKESDDFGHGYFDSYSLAGGHEFEEAVTDPDAFPYQDGWNDYQTSENGDKCAYFYTHNIRLGKYYFAVQPMWSNEANHGSGGCAYTRGTGPVPVPPLTPVPGGP